MYVPKQLVQHAERNMDLQWESKEEGGREEWGLGGVKEKEKGEQRTKEVRG
jgi:hypothetical protein